MLCIVAGEDSIFEVSYFLADIIRIVDKKVGETYVTEQQGIDDLRRKDGPCRTCRKDSRRGGKGNA